MDAKELKEYIINNDKIEIILEDLGFHKIKDNGDYISCAVPNYNNSSGLSVVKETLYCKSFTTNLDFKGSIFDLIMNMKSIEFKECIKYTHRLLGLPYIVKIKSDEPKDSILDVFKKYVNKTKSNKNKKDIKEYEDDYVFRLYEQCPYIKWIKEGILPTVQNEFNVGYSSDSNRVVYPHRYYKTGKIVGLIGRTLRSDVEIELFGINKYFPIIAYHKSQNLYGLFENMEYIKNAGEAIVFEAEKSVLKMASKNIRNCVAVCCHYLSEEQIRILISLDVNITIAYDKDVELDFIKDECKKFKGLRNVYYIYDELGLLKEKESPADKHLKIWKVLHSRKIKYKGEGI